MIITNNNMQFNYLYRDGSNYKNFGSIVLGNRNNISISQVENSIREKLIDGDYFYAEKWGIPSLFFEISNCDDHEFHEFYCIEVTNEQSNSITVEEFINRINKT